MTTFLSLTDARRGTVSRIESQSVQDQTVAGRNLIQGIGAVLFDVKFPVTFCGRPVHVGGADLDPQTPLTDVTTIFPPECTSLVASWEYHGNVVGAWDGYFTGATIFAVVKGSKEQSLWVNWTFHGPALRNPVS